MAITALPEGTVHLLGSAQALTTPTSLVKELIDNALDAKATSVEIVISQNTLDRIEVRDNGHGIPQEDLDALGRRGHTSKLRSFDELKAIGGISLGFRGEALASAVQLGEVSVTSRTDADPVATIVKVKAPGGIDSQSRTSHPIGTTVCVLKFLERIPVRKQTTLKAAPKTLVKVKELLYAYALARPTVRFSLKIAKTAKGSWIFAPRPNDGIKEAASQVIGREAAAQCMEKCLVFSQSQNGEVNDIESHAEESHLSKSQFLVEILLPKPDADPSKFGHGQFISVDSRPVSHEKGTMKRIATIFKHCLKAAFGPESEIKNPFIRLNITCPVASYDPNVEPAKDDILFSNEYLILEAIEGLFKEIYGESEPVAAVKPTQCFTQKVDNFELLLARKPTDSSVNPMDSSPSSPKAPRQSPNGLHSSVPFLPSPIASDPVIGTDTLAQNIEEHGSEIAGTRRKWGVDMSRDFAEDVGEPGKSRHLNKFRSLWPARDSGNTTATNPLNPWLIAKMTAPVRRESHDTHLAPSQSHSLPPEPLSTSLQMPRQSSDPLLLDLNRLPTPNAAVQPRRRYSNDTIRSIPQYTEDSPPYQHHGPPQRRHSSEDLRRNRQLVAPGDDEILDVETPRIRRQTDFVSARNLPQDSFVSPPATQRPKGARRSNGINKPFVPPRTSVRNDAQSDGLRQATLLDGLSSQHGSRVSRQQIETDPELEWAMDYEQRKEDATRRHRQDNRRTRTESFQTESEDVVRSSPHKNRYNSAVKALEADHLSSQNNAPMIQPLKTTLLDGDPRAYLMKQQRLMAVPNGGPLKLSRAKSMKLPLERIPNNHQIHTLLSTLATDSDHLRRLLNYAAKEDTYISRGSITPGIAINVSSMPALTTAIQSVVEKWMDSEAERKCEVEYNFDKLLSGEPSFIS